LLALGRIAGSEWVGLPVEQYRLSVARHRGRGRAPGLRIVVSGVA
jgi:hypothetical protein